MKTTLLSAIAALTLTSPAWSDPAPSDLVSAGEPALRLWHEPGPGRSVLFVHGATFPSTLSVAYRLDGRSWMDDLRRRGFDVWTFDLAGYGASEREPAFLDARADAPPYGRASAVARQIERVVAEIGRHTNGREVDIVAHSWGTVPAGLYTAAHHGRVRRLVLFGPLAPSTGGAADAPLGSAILSGRQAQWQSFAAGAPEGRPDMGEAAFDAWITAYLATDPGSQGRSPPAVRVPSGPRADSADASVGIFPYDLATMRTPTLLIRGKWDTVSTAEDLETLAVRMRQAPGGAKIVTLPRGGHRMHLERDRDLLFNAVADFLCGAPNP